MKNKTEIEKLQQKWQAISNDAYDKAIENGLSEDEAESISNDAYDKAQEEESQ
jgi:hypothetical protein